MFKKFAALLLLGVSILPAAAQTSDPAGDLGVAGHFQFRLRGLGVLPDPKATITVSGANIGGTTKVSDAAVPEVDGTYFITDHIGVEVIAATTKHTVSNSVAGRVSSVWLLPPTVTAQWHFDPTGAFRPYVGAGINYTIFYSEKASGALQNAIGKTSLGLSDSVGYALQAGVDVDITPKIFVNLDLKYIDIDTKARLTTGGLIDRERVHLDPLVPGIGIGMRF